MRKVYALSLSILLFLTGCAAEMMPGQYLDGEVVTFERIVEAPGFDEDEIYTGTKIWIAENFRSAKAVIELDSKEQGLIIGNGIIDYPCEGIECLDSGSNTVRFTMRVDIKEGKFRITFTNINIHHPPISGYGSFDTPVQFKVQKERLEPRLLSYGDRILESIKNSKSQQDW